MTPQVYMIPAGRASPVAMALASAAGQVAVAGRVPGEVARQAGLETDQSFAEEALPCRSACACSVPSGYTMRDNAVLSQRHAPWAR